MPDHLVGLHAARDDPLGQVAGVVLQRLDAAGLQHLDVVVVDRGGLGGHLLLGHRLQQVRVADPAGPLLAQLAPGAPAGGRPAAAAAAPRRPSPRRRPLAHRSMSWSVSSSVVLPCAIWSWSPWCPGPPRTRRRTRPSAAARPGKPEPQARDTCCSRRPAPASTSGMPGPLSRATTCTPRRPSCSTTSTTISPPSANRTMLRATSETAVAIRVRSVAGEARPRPPAPGRLPGRHDVGVPADRDPDLVVAALAARHAGARSAARTGRTAAGGRRRRPRVGGAGRRWTGRAAPAGTGRSAARPAPGRAGTPPAAGRGCGSAARPPRPPVEPVARPGVRVSCPATSWASRVSRSRSSRRPRASAMAACSSPASSVLVRRLR